MNGSTERFDQGFDGELSRTARRPEQFGPELTAEGHIEGLAEVSAP